MSLASLLPLEDYRFAMRFQRGAFAEFFGSTDEHVAIVEERRQWLAGDPRAVAGLLAGGEPLLNEAIALGRRQSTLPADGGPPPAASLDAPQSWQRLLALGQCWEPDYLLLKPAANGRFVLLGGCVCFPSSWSLETKLGQPLETVHAPVPGLNDVLGESIHRFLQRMQPGAAWLRPNWGLAATADRSQHPRLARPRLTADATLDDAWLRIEYQALVPLAQTGGVLFGIRIASHRLDHVARDAPAARGLARALRTMPDEVAFYKHLATARPALLAQLDEAIAARQTRT
jgi:hypothetical protein